MKVRADNEGRVIYQPGDIAGVANYSIMGQIAARLFYPKTFLFHFLLIDQYIPDEDDYSIVESVAKGPTMGRLSWYRDKDYVVFRVNEDNPDFWMVFNECRLRDHATSTPETLGELAVSKASKFGRCGYDYRLYLRMVYDVVAFQLYRLKTFHRFGTMRMFDVRHVRDKRFICTELVFAAWRAVGINLRAPDHAPLPAEFINSNNRNEIFRIDSHEGTMGEPWRPKRTIPPTEPSTLRPARPRITPGPDLIARQGGQKRKRPSESWRAISINPSVRIV